MRPVASAEAESSSKINAEVTRVFADKDFVENT